ncbi:MAG: DUF4332 domain-containing protein [Verrucomicrobiaceae bacterium]
MPISPTLDEVPGLGKLSCELLEAVGVESIHQLAESDADGLYLELAKANQILSIRKSNPSTSEILKWIETAREITGYDPEDHVTKLDVSEALPDELMVAIPVPGKSLAGQGIKVGDVPIMETGLPEAKVKASPAPKPKREKEFEENTPPEGLIPEPKKPSKSKPLEVEIPKAQVEPLPSKPRDIRTSVSPGLNAGKKEHSRSYIRGVLHPQVAKVKFGAVISILVLILIPATLVAGGMIVATNNLWWFAIPAALVFFGLLYLMFAVPVKCRICGQPAFWPKACRRHVKAHHIPLIGYILPTSVHMIVFKWFRCIYCGTSVRLKE